MKHSATKVWTINGDFLALRPNGVARYAREVTTALDRLVAEGDPLARNFDIEIVAPRHGGDQLSLDAIPVRVVPEFNRPRIPQFWVQAQLPWHIHGGLLSFCNLGPISIRKQIVCIHDLQTRLAPDSYEAGFRLAHRVLLPILGRWSAGITTVSEFSRNHLIDFGVAPEHKIVVTYNGHEHARRWDAGSAKLDLPTTRPFVLALGRRHRHKNCELLRRLSTPLDRMGIDLCIAGDLDPNELLQGGASPSANIRILGRISDDEFARALDRALCFLLPSRIEGFGLPALEAMDLGCPTVVSHAASLPEICGDAALYATPDDDDAWVTAVGRLKDDLALRERIKSKGLDRARRYSWRAIAETYLTMMVCVDERRPLTEPQVRSAFV